ncbi:uncharacterized protein ACRADG_012555 [Cochliomyia hominivorax]
MSPRCHCILCRAESNQGSNSDSSEQQVHRQERTATNCPLRQRDELRRSQSSHEGPSTSVRQQSQSNRIVRSVVRGEVQLHTTSGAPLRRTVGGRSQTGEIPTSARNRKCISHQRGNGNNARRSRGGAQQSSASTVVSRPERRRGANSSSPIDRRGSAFAAARIRRRRYRQRGEIIQALATALRSQANVLAGLVSKPNINIGQVVIIHEDKYLPQSWLTGKVVEIVEGEDGKVRVAEVKTKSGVYRRPIHKLAPLPLG